MRLAPHRRRRWNNILIVLVLLFIGVFNLPPLLKSYLTPAPEQPVSPHPSVLNPTAQLMSISSRAFTLRLEQNQWQLTPAGEISASQLAERWQSLVGTKVDEHTVRTLQPNLIGPQTIEVWYQDLEEPQRITYYQAPQFWLFKNWQDQWLAISVAGEYLFL